MGYAGVIKYGLAELASASLGPIHCGNFYFFSSCETHLVALSFMYMSCGRLSLPRSWPYGRDMMMMILYVMKCPIDIRNRSDWCCGVSGLYSSGGPRINLRMNKRRMKREQSYSVERMTRNWIKSLVVKAMNLMTKCSNLRARCQRTSRLLREK